MSFFILLVTVLITAVALVLAAYAIAKLIGPRSNMRKRMAKR